MEATVDRIPEEREKITPFRTACAFWSCGTCSESMMYVLNRAMGQPLPAEERGAMEPGKGKLARITGVDPLAMLDYASNYGLGSRRYELSVSQSKQENSNGSSGRV